MICQSFFNSFVVDIVVVNVVVVMDVVVVVIDVAVIDVAVIDVAVIVDAATVLETTPSTLFKNVTSTLTDVPRCIRTESTVI